MRVFCLARRRRKSSTRMTRLMKMIGTAVAMAMVRVWFDRGGVESPFDGGVPDLIGCDEDTDPPGVGASVWEGWLVVDSVVWAEAPVDSFGFLSKTGIAGAQISENTPLRTVVEGRTPSVYMEVMVEDSGRKQLPVSTAGR